MIDMSKTYEQKLWNAFLQFANGSYSLKKDIEHKAKAYTEAGDEEAADALLWIAEYLKRIDKLLDEEELNRALEYLDESDDTIVHNGKSYLTNFCGD